ncbi:uncharacterized protein LOC107039532 [Diachasma alloeum]|uniref:uncharacterized protein LOC107039532 n=1 Tax=Diachasma alloeum TaxID=454923 RepID=UPI000738502A|nr:uncharacterized protein LOC107039532 [Diachasma alloeum]
MSAEHNPLRLLSTLQHMAAVKTIETLLKKAKYKEMMKNVSWGIHPYRDVNQEDPLLIHMIGELQSTVDRLPLPEVMKINLKMCLVPMIRMASNWLSQFANNTPSHLRDQNWAQTIDDLLDSLHWDNIGYVNGRKTLACYVESREAVDFVIWNQLCISSMENDIIRFAKTIDWNSIRKCSKWTFPIYWYHKIYGEYSPKEMFEPVGTYNYFCIVRYKVLSEEQHLKRLLKRSHPDSPHLGRTASTNEYFLNNLENDVEIEKFIRESSFDGLCGEATLYSLRSMKMTTLVNTISNHSVLSELVKPPWILFIDDWIRLFQSVNVDCFFTFFQLVGVDNNFIKEYDTKTLYEPFEKVWRIFYRRFGCNSNEEMGQAFFNIFHRTDLTLCKAMFRELEDPQRKRLVTNMKDYVQRRQCAYEFLNKENWGKKEFFSQFYYDVLKDDEERRLFSEIFKK